MLKVIAAVLVALALALGIFLEFREPESRGFTVAGSLQLNGTAEIIQASADGTILIYTDSDNNRIGVADINDPAAAAEIGALELPGEPTGVGLSPDGRWALVTVYPESAEQDNRLPGVLALIDLADPALPATAAYIGIDNHPDSIAVTNDGDQLIGVIAVENENGGATGAVQVVKLDPTKPRNWSVATIELDEELLRNALMLAADEPQPEVVTLSPGRHMAAVSLQENNGIVLIDLSALEVSGAFSLGAVADRPADLLDDGKINLTQTYPADVADIEHAGVRFPDGISFTPGGQHLVSADEGEDDLTGGRGISIWTLSGDFVWDDGGEIERSAAEAGLYPDDRSAKRGIEMEGVTAARFASREFLFAVAERGNFLVIYDIANPNAPELVQLLPTGAGPESVVAIPARNLVAVAAEESGELSLFRYDPPAEPGRWSFGATD